MSDECDDIIYCEEEDEENQTDILDMMNSQSAEAEKLGKPKDPNTQTKVKYFK
jgi:hypothetical protein